MSGKMKVNAQEYGTEREIRDYIALCESDFESQLERAFERVVGTEGLRTITLSGPSCSGKTTTAKKLIESINNAGRRAHVVSIDDFYKNRTDAAMKMSAEGELKPDYETIASIDMDAFSDFAEKLERGGRISVPIYDFGTGSRNGHREIEVRDGDIVMLEGIQAIYPGIVSLLNGDENISIHISVGESLGVGGRVFPPDRIRLMRRLVRDYFYRSASPELTFYLWGEVRENEINNIEPYMKDCDVVLNSLLPYEVGVIAPYLRRILEEVRPDSRYAQFAHVIGEDVLDITEIPLGCVPEGSVFREFLH